MEKAILKTLIYADIFDYPMTVFEIHKWLIGRKGTLRQIEKVLQKLNKELRVKNKAGYYFLPRRDGLVEKRKRREKQSDSYLKKAQILASFLKLIPWIKLVGISGGLAMNNASKNDDIDLFIITAKNRLWISRLLTLFFLSLLGQRRKVSDYGKKIAGKFCINTLLEEDRLEQDKKDIYLAHEVLQMRPLWYRDGIYSKYLSDNQWVFKFLPNWIGFNTSLRAPKGRGNLNLIKIPTSSGFAGLLGMTLEQMAKWFQLKIMQPPKGMERIEDGALYFHPDDMRPQVLSEYGQRVKTIP